VLRAVREHDADLPVVLTTGDPSLEGVSQALDHGVLHYLIKPVPLEKLVETARRAVRLGLLARLKRDALRAQGESDHLIGDRIGLETAFARALKSLHMVFSRSCQRRRGLRPRRSCCGEPLFRTRDPVLAAERLGPVRAGSCHSEAVGIRWPGRGSRLHS
jgi:CheY-like chemotaxis protein